MKQNEIIKHVYAAKHDRDYADSFIRSYLPFIYSETAKFLKRPPIEGDDEYSIALYAFHESIMGYSNQRGAFLKFAATNIKNRLIDYYRKEKRHREGVISLHISQHDDDKTELIDTLEHSSCDVEEFHDRTAAEIEITEFAAQMDDFGLNLEEIAENCPRQGRTLAVCHKALAYAKTNPELLDLLVSSKKLPISKLAEGAGVSVKTLERHRKYMVAILLAYTNGYEVIRGHLSQVSSQKEEQICVI